MAGGFVYNVIETPELSTSEIYGKTLAELAKEHKAEKIVLGLPKNMDGAQGNRSGYRRPCNLHKITGLHKRMPRQSFQCGYCRAEYAWCCGRYGKSRTCSFCFNLLGFRFAPCR